MSVHVGVYLCMNVLVSSVCARVHIPVHVCMHAHKCVHVPMARSVCPCLCACISLRVCTHTCPVGQRAGLSFLNRLRNSRSRALRAFGAAVRHGRPGCFDHLHKLNHLQPETCPGASPQQAGGAEQRPLPPTRLGVNAAEGIVPGQQLGQAGAERNPVLERLPGAGCFAAPLPQARNPSEGLRAPSCTPRLPTVPPYFFLGIKKGGCLLRAAASLL